MRVAGILLWAGFRFSFLINPLKMKHIFIVSLLFLSSFHLRAQSFLHGAGAGFSLVESNMPGGKLKVYFTLHYYPQATFLETETFSISAGIPLTVGMSGSYNASFSSRGDSYEENSLLGLFQAPVMVNFNGGAGSSKDNEQRFGYFFGGGFGYHTVGIAAPGDYYDGSLYDYTSKTYAKGFGPAANAGLRFAVGSHQKNIEIRVSYMKGLQTFKPALLGLNAAFNF